MSLDNNNIWNLARSIRCGYPLGCNLYNEPDGDPNRVVCCLSQGQQAPGRPVTNLIMTDGTNYSWWEVACPSPLGQFADIYGVFATSSFPVPCCQFATTHVTPRRA